MTNMNVEEFKLNIHWIELNLIFGFSKKLLNLNNSCVKYNEFCKGFF
jgi:hypothetical protein